MCARHIFIILVVIFIVNHQIEAPSPGVSGGARAPSPGVSAGAKVPSPGVTRVELQRTASFKSPSRNIEVQRKRISSSSSSSTLYSHDPKASERQSKTDIKPENKIDLSEATATTFSGGNINPSQHGVYARIRNALRYGASITGGIGVGIGVNIGANALNNLTTSKNISGDSVNGGSLNVHGRSSIIEGRSLITQGKSSSLREASTTPKPNTEVINRILD